MKRIFSLALLFILPSVITAQLPKKSNWQEQINSLDLETHVNFLASPLLKGRMNGEPGLEIAQQYILSQVKLMGLKPAAQDFLQPYTVLRTLFDNEKTKIEISGSNQEKRIIQKPLFQLLPTGPADFEAEGEVIFAGYGLKQDKYGYNDMENIKAEGKILLIMSGAPTSEDGKKYLFEGVDWSSFMSVQAKLTLLMFSRAKAILIVMDPKSGFKSLDDQFPGIAGQLNSSFSLPGANPSSLQMPGLPKMLYVHREVADALLEGTGTNLEELQKKIDSSLKPNSFVIAGKHLKITEVTQKTEVQMHNVAAIVEGSDPDLKNEFIIYSAHADHIGQSDKGINYGADDNATGCAALLSMAEAFQNLEKKPLRSVMFLWVSGEEIGLYGSQSYVNNPLIPLDKTVANLNMDMIGRVKGIADTTADNPMTDINEVFVITDYQSRELVAIAEDVDKVSSLDMDYSLSGRSHPLQLFSRSDHYNFVKNDIPVLFFSTGLHTDYHTPGDTPDKIDYRKMELITEAMFQIGFTAANRKERLKVDNPFSKW